MAEIHSRRLPCFSKENKVNNNNAYSPPNARMQDRSNSSAHTFMPTDSWRRNECATNCTYSESVERPSESTLYREIDVDVDELENADGPASSIVYFPSTNTKLGDVSDAVKFNHQ